MRQIETRDGRLGCEFYRTVRIQTLHDDSLRGRDRIGVPRYARDDPVAAARSVEVTVRDRTVELQTAVGGVDPCGATLHINRSQEFFDSPGNDLLDGSQPTVTGVLSQLHLEAIAVHDSPHLIGRDEHVVLHPLHTQETVAGAV